MPKLHADITSVLTFLLAAWTVYVAVSKVRDPSTHAATVPNASRILTKWPSLITERSPVLGTANASFKIVEFSDYQCPFCAKVDPIVLQFVARHSDVALYRYDMPLQTIHRYAFTAAVAGGCAEIQGVRTAYQSLLFQHQREFATLDWTALAGKGGVADLESFSTCLRKQVPRDVIYRSIREAVELGLTGTPSFIINGNIVSGDLSETRLKRLYEERPNHR